MAEEFKAMETKAPFNMALSTLESLRRVLDEIAIIEKDPLLSDATKQNLKIRLTKRFYVNSSPLLKEDVVKKFKDILKIKAPEFILTEKGVATGNTRTRYDFELDIKLDQHLIDIQRELQKEKYLMPPKKDLGRAVGSFD